MRMKGKLKNFFFEEENSYDDLLANIDTNNTSYEAVNLLEPITNEVTPTRPLVNVHFSSAPKVVNVSTVEDIYTKANVNDTSKSVYKVDEIKSVLPNTLPTSAKKDSVLGMMKVSNLTLEDIQYDAANRTNILQSVLENFTLDTNSLIAENTNEISLLENRINELKEAINARTIEQEEQEKIIIEEINKIDSIIEFII